MEKEEYRKEFEKRPYIEEPFNIRRTIPHRTRNSNLSSKNRRKTKPRRSSIQNKKTMQSKTRKK